MPPYALIVDDEPAILDTLSGVLTDGGVECLRTTSGEEALALYAAHCPDVVFLDIWLPDRDGLETLQALRQFDPHATVVMMSGHGTTATAVKAIKMGAFEYLEKPLTYAQALETLRAALAHRQAALTGGRAEASAYPEPGRYALQAPPRLSLLREGREPQRTLRESMVIPGHGLHSGSRTGMVLQPLPPDSGIHFLSVPSRITIPAHVGMVGDTEYATTLQRDTAQVRTVEHLLSALHAAGITNLLVKLHSEVPILDGSATIFCDRILQQGIVEQDRPRLEVVVDRRYEVAATGGKSLVVEPYDGFAVSYHLSYPQPIGEQYYEFTFSGFDAFRAEIAPARTFGFLRDLKMLNELGLGSGGRLDNFILVGEDNIVNTELRFPDEFARHKILDLIGDLYLLGYPLRGRVSARLTGHRDNVAIVRQLVAAGALPEA